MPLRSVRFSGSGSKYHVGAFFMLIALAANPNIAAQSFVLNPSFESNYNDGFPHYGPIDDWTGGSGVNEQPGPFHNVATPIPDQTRIGFMQGSTQLSQEIQGLKPGRQYWIQFFYDARNCCGGTIDLVTRFNDRDLDKVTNVKAATGGAPYYSRTVPFTPDAESGKLSLATAASGDATIVLDGVTVVERDTNNVPVLNPSFEASGLPADPQGIISPARMSGWSGEGTYGVNASGKGPFADNGTAPDQGMVAFLQDISSINQRLANLVVGSRYQLSFAYNARSGNSPRLQVKVGDAVLSDEDVTPVVAANPYRTKSVTFTATEPFMVVNFAQTKAGSQTILLDDIRLTGQAQEQLPPLQFAPTAAELAPGQRTAINVTVPAKLLASRAVDIKLRSPNPAAVRLVDAAADGVLTVHFDRAGVDTKPFSIEAVARGVVRLEVVDSANLNLADDVSVNVVTSLIRNSSFESSPRPGGVGYGAILGWTGGSGLNKADGPFHKGVVPDRDQVALIQGSGKMAQEITGLIPGKNYWLQFRYNARDCCAGGTIDLSVTFGGKELVKLAKVVASSAAATPSEEYYFHNVAFTAAAASGLLEFATTAQGDATILLDAISLVPHDVNEVVLQNASFEATGSPVGVGYLQPRKIAGWEMTGGFGVNITGVGPFADNGRAIDQDRMLFMQGPGTARQLISGFTAGREYTLVYYVNARNCCGGGVTKYSVSFDGAVLLEEEVMPVTGTEPYHLRFMVIKAAAAEGELLFTTAPEGDHTLLLDDIRILPGNVTPKPPPPPSVPLIISRVDAANFQIAWSASAAGFVLQSSSSVAGPWTNVAQSATVNGGQNAVTVSIGPGARFYRLVSQ
jgi:hypothetical protein